MSEKIKRYESIIVKAPGGIIPSEPMCKSKDVEKLEAENEQLKDDKDYKRFESLLLQNNNLIKENLRLKAENESLKAEWDALKEIKCASCGCRLMKVLCANCGD